jgi:capsular polysaccharide biosynthesis protein
LTKAIETHGFEVLYPGELSLAEQIRRFSNAEVVIGAHGGGLTNIIFSNHIHLIELFTPKYINPCYFAIAGAMGHSYTPVVCLPVGQEDLFVDIGAVHVALEKIR